MPASRVLLPIAVLVVSVVSVLALQATAPEQAVELAPERKLTVDAAKVARYDLAPSVSRVGRLQASSRSVLRFEVAGVVAQRHVEPGMTVAAGDLLLTLNDGDFRDALNRAEARVEQERAAVKRDRELLSLSNDQVGLQQKEVKRLKKLGKGSLVSQSNLDAAARQLAALKTERARLRYSVDTADSRLRQLQSDVALSERQVQRTVLRAPFAGTVNTVHLEQGDFANAQQPAVEVLNRAQLDLYVELSIDDLGDLALGDSVPVTSVAEQRDGEVIALNASPDTSTMTYPLRVRVAGQGWQPGQLASVQVPLQRLENVLGIPQAALLLDEEGAAVWVVENSQVRRQSVQLGPLVEGLQVVLGGLQGNERIVISNVAALAADQPVTVR